MLSYQAQKFGLTNLETEDIVQDVMIMIFTNLQKAPGVDERNLKSWCNAIMRNMLVNYKAKTRNRDIECFYFENETSNNYLDNIDIENLEKREQLEAAIKILTEDELKLLNQRIGGLKFEEIAEHSEESVGQLYRRYSRILKKLQAYLKPKISAKNDGPR